MHNGSLSVSDILWITADITRIRQSDTDRVNQMTTETTFASTGNIESVDTLEEVPEYTGQPYVEINDNEPTFTEDELTTDSYEEYSPLDELGRCQTAEACR